jgi:hypothetical protein
MQSFTHHTTLAHLTQRSEAGNKGHNDRQITQSNSFSSNIQSTAGVPQDTVTSTRGSDV